MNENNYDPLIVRFLVDLANIKTNKKEYSWCGYNFKTKEYFCKICNNNVDSQYPLKHGIIHFNKYKVYL